MSQGFFQEGVEDLLIFLRKQHALDHFVHKHFVFFRSHSVFVHKDFHQQANLLLPKLAIVNVKETPTDLEYLVMQVVWNSAEQSHE